MWPPPTTSTIGGVLAFYPLPGPLWETPGYTSLGFHPSVMTGEAATAARMTSGPCLACAAIVADQGDELEFIVRGVTSPATIHQVYREGGGHAA